MIPALQLPARLAVLSVAGWGDPGVGGRRGSGDAEVLKRRPGPGPVSGGALALAG